MAKQGIVLKLCNFLRTPPAMAAPLNMSAPDWREGIYKAFKAADVRQISYVPDAGHIDLIKRAQADPDMSATALTTEEEGIAMSCGAWLGGQRHVILMQSSGVGNCINMLSLMQSCRFPMLALITMRGEWAEFNPWQVPMSRATQGSLELMGVSVRRVTDPAKAVVEIEAGLDDAFLSEQPVAILLSQSLLGRKVWNK
jgi:sulfopyruvate decarboxylase alpha subunit